MNYKRIYFSIIDNRKNNPFSGYTEKHHILPKSLGGTDTKDNLIRLSAKEHFICHLLLTKIYRDDKEKYPKMVLAFSMMCNANNKLQFRYTSNTFSKLRETFSNVMSDLQTGNGNSQFGKQWIHNPMSGEKKKIFKTDVIPDDFFLGRRPKKIKIDKKEQKVVYVGIHVDTRHEIKFSGIKELETAGFTSTKVQDSIAGRRLHHKKYIWTKE